jgi:hypothetical protein
VNAAVDDLIFSRTVGRSDILEASQVLCKRRSWRAHFHSAAKPFTPRSLLEAISVIQEVFHDVGPILEDFVRFSPTRIV